jgi:hypothetical protein
MQSAAKEARATGLSIDASVIAAGTELIGSEGPLADSGRRLLTECSQQ